MALRQSLTPAPSLLMLLPAVVMIPLLLVLLADTHAGGIPLLSRFLMASIRPSLEPMLMASLWHGLKVTLLTALLSWSLSSVTGLLLGALGSRCVWRILLGVDWPAAVMRRLLAPVRAVHELIWGLLLLQVVGLSGWVAVLAIALPYSALMARVVADQIDSHEPPCLPAIQATGASSAATLITALLPVVRQPLRHHISHRLDCALRSTLLLGVFGLGGLGTDLTLSLQSLQFEEMWSGLWLLAGTMLLVDAMLRLLHRTRMMLLILISTPLLGVLWNRFLDNELNWPIRDLPQSFSLSWLPTFIEAGRELPWISVISSTMMLTLLAASIAIALPPLLLLSWPGQTALKVQGLIWRILRLLPPPLTALLLLLVAKPSLAVAATALGLHHAGVMGRVMADDLRRCSPTLLQALQAAGASTRICWLMGPMAEISRGYLAYASYRGDVILRDTAVVGLVGGAGLGWELLEALSSFHWQLVMWILLVYVGLTLAGESGCERLQRLWNCKAVAL